jgi:hypothetical protein
MLKNKLYISLGASMLPLIANARSYSLDYKSLLKLSCDSIPACLQLLFKSAVDVAFPIAVVFILWSGFLFVSAGGDPAKIKTARTTLLWSVIGLTIVIGAWALAVAFQESILAL